MPLLGTDLRLKGQPGRIINISSVQGKYAMPLLGAYGTSKHAVEGMSESLRRELIPYGIDVIIFGEHKILCVSFPWSFILTNGRLK